MKVIDASVVVELVANDLDPGRLGDEELAVPNLIDSEVTNVLRRLVLSEVMTDQQGAHALEGFIRMTFVRFAVDRLRPRIWELRHNLSSYDATYVALAEVLGATSLLTADARLANAPGIKCHVELL